MIEKFKKASNTRLLKWVKEAVEILHKRGITVRVSLN